MTILLILIILYLLENSHRHRPVENRPVKGEPLDPDTRLALLFLIAIGYTLIAITVIVINCLDHDLFGPSNWTWLVSAVFIWLMTIVAFRSRQKEKLPIQPQPSDYLPDLRRKRGIFDDTLPDDYDREALRRRLEKAFRH